MKVVFDGLILEDVFLQKVDVAVSTKDPSKFDVVAHYGETVTVLETFDTEAEAKNFINTLGEKLVNAEGLTTLDAR